MKLMGVKGSCSIYSNGMYEKRTSRRKTSKDLVVQQREGFGKRTCFINWQGKSSNGNMFGGLFERRDLKVSTWNVKQKQK